MTVTPTAHDASRRRVVRLDDGRTGILIYVPTPNSTRSGGAKAKVCLRPGVVVSVPPETLTVEPYQ